MKPESDGIDSQFITLLRNRLKYLKPGEPLRVDHQLRGLGLDSMAAVDLLLDIEDTYGITLPDQYLTEETFSTTQALWDVIASLRASPEREGYVNI